VNKLLIELTCFKTVAVAVTLKNLLEQFNLNNKPTSPERNSQPQTDFRLQTDMASLMNVPMAQCFLVVIIERFGFSTFTVRAQKLSLCFTGFMIVAFPLKS
jgi:hypothetical protein